MKILFLSQRFLLPMDTGGKIRTGNILKELSQLHEITLISNVESPKDDKWVEDMSLFCSRFIPVGWKEIKKGTVGFFIKLFFQMFSIYPVSALNDYSDSLKQAVENELASTQYDIAICDFVQSALLFKEVKEIPTLLFQHNVESVISKRHIGQTSNPVAKLFWWLQWKKMFWYEKKACNNFDTVIAVSETDSQFYGELYGTDNSHTIPTGVDIEYYKPVGQESPGKNTLVFCGSMDWLPNEDAVMFFINEIMPALERMDQNSELVVVGRNPSAALSKIVDKIPNVTLTGWVEDTRPYIEECQLFIVPIRIGGGTRMKIYEAMAMGKVVISTTIGAEGLPVENNTHIVIADQPDDFARAINEFLKNDNKRLQIAESARRYVEENFAWRSVANVFSEICKKTINS